MSQAGDTLSIGAIVRHAAFHRPAVTGQMGRLLATVVRHIAHYPIRMRGTFCGSIAHADPASEWCLVAATLAAQMVATSARGQRVIAADDFFEGIMTTALAEDEILTEVRLPVISDQTRFGFYEFNRRAGDFAIAMALVTYRLADGVIAEPRVGIGGAEARPRRIPEAEAALKGRPPEAKDVPGGGRGGRQAPSIRWRISRRMRSIGATSFVRSRAVRWSSPPHERPDQGLRNDLGGPVDPTARGSGAWWRGRAISPPICRPRIGFASCEVRSRRGGSSASTRRPMPM